MYSFKVKDTDHEETIFIQNKAEIKFCKRMKTKDNLG